MTVADNDVKPYLYSRKQLHWYFRDLLVHAETSDLRKWSLIDCMPTKGTSSRGFGRKVQYALALLPDIALAGDSYFNPSTDKIDRIEFTFDDAAEVFRDHGAFRFLGRELTDFLEPDVNPDETAPAPNKLARAFYYSGRTTILSIDNNLGTLAASHRPTTYAPSMSGLRVENTIVLSLDLLHPQNLDGVTKLIYDLSKFFGSLSGRPQNFTGIALEQRLKNGRRRRYDVYWPFHPRRAPESESRASHAGDVLCWAVDQPEEFSNIFRSWMTLRDEERASWNAFMNSFNDEHRYGMTRIMCISSAFELLPFSDSPKLKLDAVDEAAFNEAKKLLKSIGNDDIRDRALTNVGFALKPSLRIKIEKSAQLITAKIGNRLPELSSVIRESVNCRNQFVHGTSSTIAREYYKLLPWFVDCLEFIFVCSNFIRYGWNIARYFEQRRDGHFVYDFCANYEQNKREHFDPTFGP